MRAALRQSRANQIYRKTGNVRAVRPLLGHTNEENTVRYLGIEVDDDSDLKKGRQTKAALLCSRSNSVGRLAKALRHGGRPVPRAPPRST